MRSRCMLCKSDHLTMTNEMTFTTHSLFDNIAFDKDAEYWYFYFADKIFASSSGFWRLLIENKIEVIKDTFDLVLSLTDGHRIEIYISSSGYETYDFSIDNKRYIGLGSGDIAVIDNSKY